MFLKKNSRGAKVKAMQERLRALGYPVGAVDGIFGHQTELAVRAFQADHGLWVDGEVGPQTWPELFGGNRLPTIPRPTKEYINRVMFDGREVYDALDELIAAVSAGEGGRFDAINRNTDGEGLSFGYLQWAQKPGSLYRLLAAMERHHHQKFVAILGGGDEAQAAELLAKTKGGGKQLPLWNGVWSKRFQDAGRQVEFQRVQRQVARQETMDKLREGYRHYPERFKPKGKIALRALVMMADVGNQAGPRGLIRGLGYARQHGLENEEKFIRKLGEYVENIIARKYGDPNYGDTQGRHGRLIRQYSMARVDWPELEQSLATAEV